MHFENGYTKSVLHYLLRLLFIQLGTMSTTNEVHLPMTVIGFQAHVEKSAAANNPSTTHFVKFVKILVGSIHDSLASTTWTF